MLAGGPGACVIGEPTPAPGGGGGISYEVNAADLRG